MAKQIFAISNHGHFLGGGEHSFLDLLTHLPSDWQPMAIIPYEGELATRLKQRGVATHDRPLPTIRPWTIVQVFSALNGYLRLCSEHRPLLIYANGPRAALYGGVAGRILGIPVIWHCRVALSDPLLDPLLIRLSTRIVANSQATAKRFSQQYSPKINVIYNGLDIEWLQQSEIRRPDLIQESWKVILCVARVSKWKRHDLILSAFEKVAKFDPLVHLVCLGAKDNFEREWWDLLQERTRQSAFSQRIHWIGRVDDIRPWYRSADVLVLSSEKEPFGRVIIEAMACGVPVIAAGEGGIPEIVRHGRDGILIPPDNSQHMAVAIACILEDYALRIRLSKSAMERANVFNLDAHVNKMTQFFKDTIKNGK